MRTVISEQSTQPQQSLVQLMSNRIDAAKIVSAPHCSRPPSWKAFVHCWIGQHCALKLEQLG
jgi:hypothetical protein